MTLAVSVAACVGRGTYGLYFGPKSKVTVGLDVVYLGLLNYEQLRVVIRLGYLDALIIALVSAQRANELACNLYYALSSD